MNVLSLQSCSVVAIRLTGVHGGSQGGKDNVARSIEYYHKALSLRPEDSLSTEMLTLALQVCPPCFVGSDSQ